MTKYGIQLKILRRKFKYWYPGTDVVKEIIDKYGKYIENNDILVISEKALSIALGNIYDESRVYVDVLTKIFTYLVTKVLWLRLLRFVFKKQETLLLLDRIPIGTLSAHKKLALRYGGFKHFLKPISEAGIDTTNLPYSYVSLPLKNLDRILNSIRFEIFRKLRKHVNILVIDTDKAFRPRFLKNIAFASRTSSVKGVIDLGVYAYFMGKTLRKFFKSYPTPVAYSGIYLGLPLIFKIAKVCERISGYGLGRNILEMFKTLGKKDFKDITWIDMDKVRHYPVLLVKIKLKKLQR